MLPKSEFIQHSLPRLLPSETMQASSIYWGQLDDQSFYPAVQLMRGLFAAAATATASWRGVAMQLSPCYAALPTTCEDMAVAQGCGTEMPFPDSDKYIVLFHTFYIQRGK